MSIPRKHWGKPTGWRNFISAGPIEYRKTNKGLNRALAWLRKFEKPEDDAAFMRVVQKSEKEK